MTTFCWLPPDSVETASVGAPILMRSRAMAALDRARQPRCGR